MFEELPKDPIILLSFVNTRLRDCCPDLDALCKELQVEKKDLTNRLGALDYEYDPTLNQFV